MHGRNTINSNLTISLSSALKGSAPSWFSQISYSGIDWSHFREIFLQRKRSNTDRGQIESPKRIKACGQVGHIALQCADRREPSSQTPSTSGKSSAAENRRVDDCNVKPVSSQLTHKGQSLHYWFDSGSEFSLIKETLAKKRK